MRSKTTRFLNATDPRLLRQDMQNARRLPKLSTNSRSFEFVVPTHYLRADPADGLSNRQKGTPFDH